MEQANKTGGRGGARPGAGRPPKPPEIAPEEITSEMVLNLMRQFALGQKKMSSEQLRAAMAVLSYETKTPAGRPLGSGSGAAPSSGRPPGKKEERQQAAAGASSGAFATARPPAHMRQSDDD